MNTKTAKGVIEVAGFAFEKNHCGIGWRCIDNNDGSVIAEHGQLGKLIQQVADKLGL